jgi:oligogalacturonide transport system substrate-binding protein
MYEMKPWIQGEWAGTYMWNSTINKYSDNLKPPAKLELGSYPMLPGATDAGLFFKPAQMLSIGKSTKNPEAAAKVINFLLNSKEGVDTLGLERGVPLSKVAVQYLTEDGTIKETIRRYRACVWRSPCRPNSRYRHTLMTRRSSPSSAPLCSTSTTGRKP